MKPYKQLVSHDPENGRWGDCFRTAIACLLDLDPERVPHVCHGDITTDAEAVDRMNEWLKDNYDLKLISVPYTCEDRQLVLDTVGGQNPGIHYLLTGKSRTGCNHNVICLDNQIVHDPSPLSADIVGPASDGFYWINFLGRLL